MLNNITDTVIDIWKTGRRVKQSPSGWMSANAVCCTHNGETADTRGRGGLISPGDGSVNWHCFNCNFKTGYQPGRHLSYKFRKLLAWMGADENTIRRLVIEAVRIRDSMQIDEIKEIAPQEEIVFETRSLPEQARTLYELAAFYELNNWQSVPPEYHAVVEYLSRRAINFKNYEFYWTPETAHNLHKRVIIPCVWQGRTIGYTARAVVGGIKPKYYSQYEPNFVFNVDRQKSDSKFVIVCEGPFDAISIDGVAVLGNTCSERQADIIDSLQREVILVPDGDSAGKKLVSAAIEYGWTVSFPVWLEKFKDVNDAVANLGRLFVLKSILDARETSRLKIELRSKKLYS